MDKDSLGVDHLVLWEGGGWKSKIKTEDFFVVIFIHELFFQQYFAYFAICIAHTAFFSSLRDICFFFKKSSSHPYNTKCKVNHQILGGYGENNLLTFI